MKQIIKNMDKERIEKAASEYTKDILDANDFEINYEEDNYDAGSHDAICDLVPKSFKDGAAWRINSVWHRDKNDVPEEHQSVVVKILNDDGNEEFWVEEYNKEYHALENSGIDWDEVLMWAYISDLIPKGGVR